MGKPTGFMEYKRARTAYEPAETRIKHWREFEKTFEDDTAREQAARCMDCGVPFCHGDTGCPTDNLIPEWNDLVYRGRWKEALENLHSTNNFPEFTGWLCPAPCESACVLGITDPAVTIKQIERAIIARGFEEGWVEPKPPREMTGKSAAIIGSGPAGLAAAQQLARAGHAVTVFEKADKIGGLLRYGIPDFKMEKFHIDRRLKQMELEGVRFRCGVHVGVDIEADQLLAEFDAVILAMGAEDPIPLHIPGADLQGVHWAMDYLIQANRVVAGEKVANQIQARDKRVIVIGGGDTGSDCIGTANRQGARSIINFRRSQQPPTERPDDHPWPLYPEVFRTSTSHEEGVERHFQINPRQFRGTNGKVTQLVASRVEKNAAGRFEEKPDSEIVWDADLVLLAMGYRGPVRSGLVEQLQSRGLQLDANGNVAAGFGRSDAAFKTSLPGVYACGDVRRGQSLIVWAISEGRKCAQVVHHELLASLRK
ncbi:MAG: glutamate synthase subunit beta [Leptospirales bacterium]|nr:glutamate synthase subunit beta [Leptospirales bacterium]